MASALPGPTNPQYSLRVTQELRLDKDGGLSRRSESERDLKVEFFYYCSIKGIILQTHLLMLMVSVTK
jgi:hypothetical protein